jgi:hypothetical protein
MVSLPAQANQIQKRGIFRVQLLRWQNSTRHHSFFKYGANKLKIKIESEQLETVETNLK